LVYSFRKDIAGYLSPYRSCHQVVLSTVDLAPVYFMLLQIDPEERGDFNEFLDRYSHGFQLRKREVFGVFSSSVHPLKGYTGIGFYTVIDLFHVMLLKDDNI
jgi:hypothetical protein